MYILRIFYVYFMYIIYIYILYVYYMYIICIASSIGRKKKLERPRETCLFKKPDEWMLTLTNGTKIDEYMLVYVCVVCMGGGGVR